MKIRWFIYVDPIGNKSDPVLQYYDKEYKCWTDVETVEVEPSNNPD